MKIVALTGLGLAGHKLAICITFGDGESRTAHHMALCFSKQQAREQAGGCDDGQRSWLDGRLEGINSVPNDNEDGIPDVIVVEGPAVPFLAVAIDELRELRRARELRKAVQLVITMPFDEFMGASGPLVDAIKQGGGK